MKGLLFVFVLLAQTGIVVGQSFSLQGRVIDSKTREPIPFASVFFVSTTLGAITKEDGSYQIEKIPSGKFELMASSVGYKKFLTSLIFSDSSFHMVIQLDQDMTTLKEVVVRPDRSDFKKYYSV